MTLVFRKDGNGDYSARLPGITGEDKYDVGEATIVKHHRRNNKGLYAVWWGTIEWTEDGVSFEMQAESRQLYKVKRALSEIAKAFGLAEPAE